MTVLINGKDVNAPKLNAYDNLYKLKKQLLDFCIESKKMRDIKEHMHPVPPKNLEYHIKKLIKGGLLKRQGNKGMHCTYSS
jgi:predicted MarR family transcription regulator